MNLKDDAIIAGTYNGNEVIGQPAATWQSSVTFGGTGSRVVFGQNVTLEHSTISVLSANSIIELGDNISLIRCQLVAHPNGSITVTRDSVLRGAIGANPSTHIKIGSVRCAWPVSIRSVGADITIGDDCLFSDVTICSSDFHYLFDEKNTVLNPPKPVFIGNHVWLARQVMVLKGSVIEDNAVLGARSMVTGTTIPTGCLAVGQPAKVVRENITWR